MTALEIAWKNLRDRRARTIGGLAGVTMAVLLIYLQLGFVGAAESTATVFLERMDCDVFLTSPHYVQSAESYTIDRARLGSARGVEGVKSVTGLYSRYGNMRFAGDLETTRVQIFGFKPGEPVFTGAELSQVWRQVRATDSVAIDGLGRITVGPELLGKTVEVNNRQVTVREIFGVGGSFTGDTTVLVSSETFSNLMGGYDLDQVNMGLVKLEAGADPEKVMTALRERLPKDVRVIGRGELVRWEQHYWVDVKPVGIMFRFGVLVAFVVGAAVLYQVMTAEASNRRREFATLKAVGFAEREVMGVIWMQAMMLAAGSFAMGTVLALGAYGLIERFAAVTVEMTPTRMALVLVLAMALGTGAALGAVRRVSQADPAELFS